MPGPIWTKTLRKALELDDLLRQLHELAEKNQFPSALIPDILVIADELLSNLLKYGAGDWLQLSAYQQDGAIELRCADNGTPFNPLQADRPDLDLPMEEREIGGLGLELILAMTTEQNYRREDEQNHLTLTLSNQQ